MTTPRAGHTATLLMDGRVLIAGGYNTAGDTATAELYDPATGTFVRTGDLLEPRSAHTATLLMDGRVLIAGGTRYVGFSWTAGAELYDPSSGTFQPAGLLIEPCGSQSAILLSDGRVLLAGGDENIDRNGDSTTCRPELYDPATGKFRVAGEMSTIQRYPTVTLLADGTVLLATPDRRGSEFLPPATAELYDSREGGFRRIGQSFDLYARHAAALLVDGRVLLTGGGTSSLILDGAMLYNPATRTFSEIPGMHFARALHSATPLPDGTVLIAGGYWSWVKGTVPTAEVYDPFTGAFVLTRQMTAGRALHTATLLNTGEVLITGGWSRLDENRSTLEDSAEIYAPAAVVPAPELLTVSQGNRQLAAVLHASTPRLVSPDDPALPGEVLEIYLTGLADGSVIPPLVAIGDRSAEVLWFGKTPGYPGLNQIDVRLPDGLVPGDVAVPVRLIYRGRISNETTLAVR